MLHAEPFETHLLSAELCILFIYFLKGNCIGLEYHIILSKIHIIVIIKTKIIDKNKSCSNKCQHQRLRGLLRRLNYISRFISNMTATCEPIFKLLKKNQGCEWNEDCQKAFDNIKEYFLEPPILLPPVEERPLIMYLTVLENSMGCVLGQHDESG